MAQQGLDLPSLLSPLTPTTMDPDEWSAVLQSCDQTLRTCDAKLTNQISQGRNDKEKRQIRVKMDSVKQDLDRLEAVVSAWQKNPKQSGMSDPEMRKRLRALQTVQASFTKIDTSARNLTSARDALLSGYDPNAREVREETEDTMYASNRDLNEQVQRKFHQDEDALDQISSGLGHLKNIGLQQQKQFVKQGVILDELTDHVDVRIV